MGFAVFFLLCWLMRPFPEGVSLRRTNAKPFDPATVAMDLLQKSKLGAVGAPMLERSKKATSMQCMRGALQYRKLPLPRFVD